MTIDFLYILLVWPLYYFAIVPLAQWHFPNFLWNNAGAPVWTFSVLTESQDRDFHLCFCDRIEALPPLSA